MELEESPQLKLYTLDSQERLVRAVTRADNFELGLVFPADLDRRIEAGEAVELEGYAAYWIDEAKIEELRRLFEDEITFYAGTPVTVAADLERLYPQDPAVPSSGFMVSMAIVLVLTMLGVLVVVHLMLEEKQEQTLDALMVSPASPLQMILGKAVTGVVYCTIGVIAVYALNAPYIVNWGLALCAGLCGSLFTVGLGLLLGTIFETRQQLTLWGFLLMNVLLLPMFLVIMDDLLPAAAVKVMRAVPTSVIAWLVRASFPPRTSVGQTLARLGYLLAWAAVAFALGAWRVRRLER
jgi:ABC-type Na+ efflux pump permease subunit